MIVETHEIVRNANKKVKTTITGRSLETFAENRPTLGSAQPLFTGGVANVETITGTPEGAALILFRQQLMTGHASADDRLPNVNIYLDIADPDTSSTHVIRRGDVYTRAMELLRICDAGIKIVRPNGAQTTLDIVIYDGTDRTTSVVFKAQNEDLEDANYFWSSVKYRNYAQISAKTHARLYRHRDELTNQTGFARRIMYVEAGDLEGAFSPPLSTDAVASRGQNAMDSSPKLALMQAKISPTAKPKYKFQYNVGDIVQVIGEFATSQPMRVTEHILTVDKTGIRGHPALTAI
jgi:hypothetical protein